MRRVIVASLAASFLVAGCAEEARSDRYAVVVSAAASLTDAFVDIAAEFERETPFEVILNFAGSSTLREQILEGAPVDVFASANPATMERVVADVGTEASAVVFARNSARIAVPAGNPGRVTSVADFASVELVVGVCAESVPCGALARRVFANARVEPSIDTNEPNVRALLAKVEAGELDAAVVYVTDTFESGGGVVGVEIPDEVNELVEYPIAVLASASNPDGANVFMRFVLSEAGQTVLRSHGFRSP